MPEHKLLTPAALAEMRAYTNAVRKGSGSIVKRVTFPVLEGLRLETEIPLRLFEWLEKADPPVPVGYLRLLLGALEDMPRLLDEVERLEGEKSRLFRALDWWMIRASDSKRLLEETRQTITDESLLRRIDAQLKTFEPPDFSA